MLVNINIKNIFFLDIETVSSSENFEDLDGNFQQLLAEKIAWQKDEEYGPNEYYKLLLNERLYSVHI